ncbi:MAG TPA: hypothetical protein VGQ62_23405 [Chloroflexota bacterium]|jgi:hypothetical protein|nr:hypothetical protein [Chloroflexota bacterium]
MQFRLKVLVPVAFGIAAVLPTAGFAQEAPSLEAPTNDVTNQPPTYASFCGSVDLPIARSGELVMPQPDALGIHDQGQLNYSAVRGSIVHMEGNLVLLKIDQAGMGNAAPNTELAGDTWSVVRLPSQCALSDFRMGSPILAIGTPSPQGILEAIEVTQTA